MKRILWIDDERPPVGYDPFNTIIFMARSYTSAIYFLHNEVIDLVDFDHDLGEQKTGYDIAKYMVENNYPTSVHFHIHSMNPVGSANIRQLLTHYNYQEE